MKSHSIRHPENANALSGQAFIEMLMALAVFLPLILGLGSLLHLQERRLLCIAHGLNLLQHNPKCPTMVFSVAPLAVWHQVIENGNPSR